MKKYATRVLFTDRSVDSVNRLFKEIRKFPLLNENEEYLLWLRMSQGDTAARNRLITSNMRFVASLAKPYIRPGVQFEDLMSAGFLGLTLASYRFNGSLGYRFTTFAKEYVLNEIRKMAYGQRCYICSLDEPAYRDDDSEDTKADFLHADVQYEADWALECSQYNENCAHYIRNKYNSIDAQVFIDYLNMTSKGYGLSDVAKKHHLTERHVKECIRKLQYDYRHTHKMAA